MRPWHLFLVVLLLLVGCQQPAATVTTERGILVAVESRSLQDFESFVLRTDDGRELTFRPAPDFQAGGGHAMTPGHMRQHMALADPVVVTYRQQGDVLLAVSVTDAT